MTGRPPTVTAMSRAWASNVVLILLVTAVAGACGDDDGRAMRPPRPDQTASITTAATTTVATEVGSTVGTLGSTDSTTASVVPPLLVTPWNETSEIDQAFSCNGEGVSPAMSWNNLPAGTVELAVVVTDRDFGGYVHWVLAGIDPSASPFFQQGSVPPGAVEALNGSGQAGWLGPCPPPGERHTYDTILYALNRPSGVTPGQDAAAAIAAVQAVAFSSATVSGDYGG